MKNIIFNNPSTSACFSAYYGGKCGLPTNIKWPVDKDGYPLLHLATHPGSWISELATLHVSIFTPFDVKDCFKHWDLLTTEPSNPSKIIIHDNSGDLRDEFSEMYKNSGELQLNIDERLDSTSAFCSKISTDIAWLQDVDAINNHQCLSMLDGSEFDNTYTEPAIFTDGYIYCFFRKSWETAQQGDCIGAIAFQFS